MMGTSLLRKGTIGLPSSSSRPRLIITRQNVVTVQLFDCDCCCSDLMPRKTLLWRYVPAKNLGLCVFFQDSACFGSFSWRVAWFFVVPAKGFGRWSETLATPTSTRVQWYYLDFIHTNIPVYIIIVSPLCLTLPAPINISVHTIQYLFNQHPSGLSFISIFRHFLPSSFGNRSLHDTGAELHSIRKFWLGEFCLRIWWQLLEIFE